MFEIAYTQHSGGAGRQQQDAIWTGNSILQSRNARVSSHGESAPVLLAVADGVAASNRPARASRFVVESLSRHDHRQRLTGRQVRDIQAQLAARYAGGNTHGSATTLVAARVTESGCEIVNVGDSRAYLFSADGSCRQLSYDHTILNALIATGEVRADDDVAYAQIYQGLAHCLTADSEEYGFALHYEEAALEKGAGLLLCSDGLHDAIGDAAIRDLYRPERTATEQVEMWRKAVIEAGVPDNLSILLARRFR
jgi:serine/threonine protein phosphatase PrpC